MEMREILCRELEKLMKENDKIVVIDADVSKANGTANLRKTFPDRALNVGVAEQNMASIAAGLSSYGFITIILSFTPFVTRRICDQIAVSIAYSGQNVKIIGTDPGIAAELNGGTHMSVEDVGIIRSIPTAVIFEPVDNIQLKKSLPQIINYTGLVYIRMFRKNTPDVFSENYNFDLMRADILKEGKDVTILSTGIMVDESLKAKKILDECGIDAEIINIHTIKPIDEEIILKSVTKTQCVVTCENHNIIGGLRSAVAELLIEKFPIPLESIGINDVFGEVGKMDELKSKFNMTCNDIVKKVKKVISRKS